MLPLIHLRWRIVCQRTVGKLGQFIHIKIFTVKRNTVL